MTKGGEVRGSCPGIRTKDDGGSGEHREMDGFQRIQKENRNHFVTDGMWKENKVSRMTSTFLA